MSKLNIILAALAVVQVALLFFTGADDATSTRAADPGGQKPYEKLSSNDVAFVELTDGSGQSLKLERREDGDKKTWVLPDVGGYPVKDKSAEDLLGSVRNLVRGRVVTKKSANLTSLQISNDRFARHVVMKNKDGKKQVDFYIGEGRQWSSVFYRPADEDIGYQATGLSTYDLGTDSSAWIDTTFTDLTTADVASLRLERDGSVFEVKREELPTTETPEKPKDETPEVKKPEDETPTDPKPKEWRWILVEPTSDRTLDKAKVDSLVGGLCHLTLAAPIGQEEKPAFGLEKPHATATLTMADGARHTIKIGSKREDKNDHHARRSGLDFVVTVRTWPVTDHFEKKLEDLFVTPEAPKDPDLPPKDSDGK